MFLTRLHDADAEAAETQVWLDFACRGSYLSPELHQSLRKGYEEVGRLLGAMIREPSKFGAAAAGR
jgi:four helix bundle protein